MTKLLYAIFAHPDDEAFGVSPTLIKERHEGTEINLVTLTAGEAGENPDNVEDLGATRLEEWQRSARIIGAASTTHLGYRDGALCNADIDGIVASITDIVTGRLQEDTSVTQLEFMSFDLTGLTGHVDHMVASHATLLAYHRLKTTFPDIAMCVCLLCITRDELPEPNTDWRYMPAGRDMSEITKTVDASEYWDEVVSTMKAHHSQRKDCENHLQRRGDMLCVNHYIVLE